MENPNKIITKGKAKEKMSEEKKIVKIVDYFQIEFSQGLITLMSVRLRIYVDGQPGEHKHRLVFISVFHTHQ